MIRLKQNFTWQGLGEIYTYRDSIFSYTPTNIKIFLVSSSGRNDYYFVDEAMDFVKRIAAIRAFKINVLV